MPEYRYATTARWTGARSGEVVAEPYMLYIDFSAPPEFQGEAGKWTPEHLLMAAVTSCYVTTFRAIAEFSRFEYDSLEVAAEGVLEKAEGGFRFTRLTVRPTLLLAAGSDEERARRLLEKAERGCLISRSINAQITLEPRVQIAVAA